MDDRLATPPIACMHTNDFSEAFLDRRNERMVFREIESGERDTGCGHAAEEWACVVCFWGGHFLVFDLGAPERVGFLSLSFSDGGEEGVGPCAGFVAVLE